MPARLAIFEMFLRLRIALYLFAGLIGAALLSLPAAYYRVDHVSCANWPLGGVNAALAAVYVGSVALLAVCWLGFWSARPSLRLALFAGVLLHAVALLAPPFLSTDPLFYAAIGRAMAKYHASPYAPLHKALPLDDSLMRLLNADWQSGTSAYFFGWNELSRGIAWLAGDKLIFHLRLYQGLSLVGMATAAFLTGLAARVRDSKRAGSAAAAVLLCPLAVIEGTVSAHNDSLLALAVALFVFATSKDRPLAGFMATLLGLAIKASALLLLGFQAIAWMAGRLRLPLVRSLYAALLFLGISLLVFASGTFGILARLTAEIGRYTDLFSANSLQCERAVECALRWLLWKNRHFTASFAVGMVFRAAGALWLLYAALRAGRDKQLLPWLALGIFVYYLYFHAYVQAWYLLPLLPLLPFASARTRPAMTAACLTWVCHYAAVLPFNCRASTQEIWLERVAGLGFVLLFPSVLLLRRFDLITCRRFRSPSSMYR